MQNNFLVIGRGKGPEIYCKLNLHRSVNYTRSLITRMSLFLFPVIHEYIYERERN